MKGFVKFLILAMAGFALGAGAAWLQQPHVSTPQFPAAKVSTPSDASPIAEAPKAETPKTETAGTEKPAAEAAAAEPAKAETAKSEATEVKTGDGVEENAAEEPAAAPKTEDLTAPEPDEKPSPEATGKVETSPEVIKNLAAAKGDVPVSKEGIGGAFALFDHDGKPVTDKSWPRKYLLVFFGFTNCPDVCPVTLDKLTSALDQLGGDASKVQPLFITIDSFRDKPGVLKEYVSHFHKSILGLTGSEEQLKAAQDAYKIYASRHDQANGHDYTFDHSAFVYFMAPDGKMAEVISVNEKASDIADRLRPYLEGKKQAGDAAAPGPAQ